MAWPWHSAGTESKKAMVQPTRIVCPDFGIDSIEAAETFDDAGETIHTVVFDDETPDDEPAGQCLIQCTPNDLGDLRESARTIVWDQLEWHIEDAGDVGAVTPEPDDETNDIVYPEMPAHNDGFGRRTLSLRFKDRHEWTDDAELELRFHRDGTGAADQHHEQLENVAAGNPNWYVYWQQVGPVRSYFLLLATSGTGKMIKRLPGRRLLGPA